MSSMGYILGFHEKAHPACWGKASFEMGPKTLVDQATAKSLQRSVHDLELQFKDCFKVVLFGGVHQ